MTIKKISNSNQPTAHTICGQSYCQTRACKTLHVSLTKSTVPLTSVETDGAVDGAVSYMLRLTALKDIFQQKPATIPLISYARITIDLRLGSHHRVV